MKKASRVFLLVLLAAAPAAHGQIVTNIAYAKRETTNFFWPDDTTNRYQVHGRITSPNFSTNFVEFYIQDTNDNVGILVSSTAFPLDTNAFQIGFDAQVTDYIGQTNGVRMINPTLADRLVVANSNAITVQPVLATFARLLAAAESNEARFVTVTNITIGTNWPGWGSSMAISATDATGQLTLYIKADTDIDGQLPPTNAFDVKGIFTQYDTNAIPTNGYRIMPRYYSDFIQRVGQQPPSLFALRTSYTAIVNAPFNMAVLGRDRNAGDRLYLATSMAPTGSTFTDYGNREGLFAWTPSPDFLNTTNTVIFRVTDGQTTNTTGVAVAVCPASGGPGYAWINEFHYHDLDGDTNQGVELAGSSGIDLSNYYLLLCTPQGIYSSNDCSGVIDDEGAGYGAAWFPISGVSTSSPSGIILMHKTKGLLQFLSYEGSFMPTDGPAAGVVSVDVGVTEPGWDGLFSLQLQGAGVQYEDFTWAGPLAATPGTLNAGQDILVAEVDYTNLTTSPNPPEPDQAFNVVCVITPNDTASNLVSTAWYRLNGGSSNSISMTNQGGYTNMTVTPIPAQTNGTLLNYYVFTSFDGPGTNSPAISVTNSVTIFNNPPIFSNLFNKSVTEGGSLTFSVTATDVEGDAISLSMSNAPPTAILSSTNGNGTFICTNATPAGVYTTAFYAADSYGFSTTSIVITVYVRPLPFTNDVVFYDFDLGTANFTNIAAYVAPQLSASIFARDTGTNTDYQGNPPSGRAIGYTDWKTNIHYFTFTVTVTNGYQLNLTGLTFDHYQSSSGPLNWFIRSSADGFASNLGSGVNTNNSLFATASISLSLSNLTNSIIFQFHGTNASLATGTWRLDNVHLQGLVSPLGGLQDGIPISWWQRYGLGPTNTAANDLDGDGANNYEEYVADTNPTNPASFFDYRVDSATGFAVMVLSAGPPTTNSRLYDAFWNTNLIGGSWTAYGYNFTGKVDGSALAITVTNGAGIRFYRTGVKVP